MLQDIGRTGRQRVWEFRELLCVATSFAICCVYATTSIEVQAAAAEKPASLEQWDTIEIEIELEGPNDGNPFLDVELSGTFETEGKKQTVAGFYDGGGIYRIRFMPDKLGRWKYTTESNKPALSGKHGEFEVTAPSGNNHGPVRVADTFHFKYADGTPYRQLGTTCYAWTHQSDALEAETLKTLAASPFNKLRMCVFPKRYTWNMAEPPRYPFEGTPPNKWDYTQFNPAFFQHLE